MANAVPAQAGGRKHDIAVRRGGGADERECLVSCGLVGTGSPSLSAAESAAKMVHEEEAAESERRRFWVITGGGAGID